MAAIQGLIRCQFQNNTVYPRGLREWMHMATRRSSPSVTGRDSIRMLFQHGLARPFTGLLKGLKSAHPKEKPVVSDPDSVECRKKAGRRYAAQWQNCGSGPVKRHAGDMLKARSLQASIVLGRRTAPHVPTGQRRDYSLSAEVQRMSNCATARRRTYRVRRTADATQLGRGYKKGLPARQQAQESSQTCQQEQGRQGRSGTHF
jgi:hypothetical protein